MRAEERKREEGGGGGGGGEGAHERREQAAERDSKGAQQARRGLLVIIMTKAPGKHPFNLLAYRHAVVPTIHTTYDRHHHQPPIMLVTLWPVREWTVRATLLYFSPLSLSLSPHLRSFSALLSFPHTVILFTMLTSTGKPRYLNGQQPNSLDSTS